MSTRALRRHHEQRMKRRVTGYYGGYARQDPRHIGKIAHARKMCSCWMCGNPRRLGELTLQERRSAADQAAVERISDADA